jgi:tetratricopeptide (TPR) repeat protein
VRFRLLKGILFLAIAAIAAALYLKMARKELSLGPLKSAHKAEALSKAAALPMPGKQQEKEMLTIALEKSPGHAPVLLKLAAIESEEGHLQDAAGHLRKILETEHGNPEANLELGKVLFQLGDIRGAIDHTEGILKTHPAYEDALYNMGAIYANIGNRKGALEYWKRLTALNSHSESAQKAQQMMSRLVAGNP